MSIKTWKERITTPLTNQQNLFASMQAEIDEIRSELVERKAERDALRAHIHTCGPTCTKAGCINARLSEEIEQLTETSVWQAGRISELLDEVARQRKVLEMALEVLVNHGSPYMGLHIKYYEAASTAIQEQLKCSAPTQ